MPWNIVHTIIQPGRLCQPSVYQGAKVTACAAVSGNGRNASDPAIRSTWHECNTNPLKTGDPTIDANPLKRAIPEWNANREKWISRTGNVISRPCLLGKMEKCEPGDFFLANE
jgi:hypothetical protein